MFKNNRAPIFTSIIITAIGLLFFMFIYEQAKDREINIQDPVIDLVVDSDEADFKTIIHQAEKNVVQIESQNQSETLTGSGFLFNHQGDIITNAHVIENSEQIYVRTANAHIFPAALVGIGKETDIAVIRVPQLAGETYLPLEDEIMAEIGDEVIALGSPHGFQNTVTLGIISGTERNFSVDGFEYRNVYQISAPITHGNSGGPLINRETGYVIGVNSVGTEDGTIGFSIPINEIIEDVKSWSAEVHNDDLEFPSTADILKFNPEQLKEDAAYLIDYFFEGIKLREYVNAYTLFGSELQDQISYSTFREQYIHTVELNYEQIANTINEDRHSESIVNVVNEQKLQNEDETELVELEYTFTIGYENDQLKILDIISN